MPGRGFVLGSDRSCDFVVGDESVGARHAELVLDDDQAFVTDLGCPGGTAVIRNGVREPVLRRRLVSLNDVLCLGDIEIPVEMIVDRVQRKRAAASGSPPAESGRISLGARVDRPAPAPAREPAGSASPLPPRSSAAAVAPPRLSADAASPPPAPSRSGAAAASPPPTPPPQRIVTPPRPAPHDEVDARTDEALRSLGCAHLLGIFSRLNRVTGMVFAAVILAGVSVAQQTFAPVLIPAGLIILWSSLTVALELRKVTRGRRFLGPALACVLLALGVCLFMMVNPSYEITLVGIGVATGLLVFAWRKWTEFLAEISLWLQLGGSSTFALRLSWGPLAGWLVSGAFMVKDIVTVLSGGDRYVPQGLMLLFPALGLVLMLPLHAFLLQRLGTACLKNMQDFAQA